MRTAIVSDIHGSLTALEAVIADIKCRGVDGVLHVGDLALMGPQASEVVDRIRELGWPGVQGNCEEVVCRLESRDEQIARAPKVKARLEWVYEALGGFTAERLGDERLAWLAALPLELDEDGVRLVHASPGDSWRAGRRRR